jgi:hypothetical protein
MSDGSGLRRRRRRLRGFAQKTWSHIPMLPIVSNNGDGFLVVSDEHVSEHCVTFGLEGNAITDAKLKHL